MCNGDVTFKRRKINKKDEVESDRMKGKKKGSKSCSSDKKVKAGEDVKVASSTLVLFGG